MIKRFFLSIKLMSQATRFYTVVKILLMFISALCTPFSVYVMQKMIEKIENFIMEASGIKPIISWVTVFALINLWVVLQTHLENVLRLVILKKLKENLLPLMANKVSKIKYSYFEKSDCKDVFYQLEKAPHEMILTIFDETLNLVKNTISLLGIAYVFTQVSLWFFAIFLVVLIPVLWSDYKSSFIVKKMHQSQTFAERQLAYYDSLLLEKYNLSELKIMNGIGYIRKIWNEKAKKVLGEHVKATIKSQFLLLTSTLLLFVFSASIMGMFLYSIYHKIISVSTFVVLVNAIQSIYTISYNLSDSITSLGRRMEKMEYFETFFSIPNQQDGKEILNSDVYEIEFKHVSFTYPDEDEPVFSDLSFCIHAGEKICIVGENGAGKSTIIKLLCGLYQPDRGSISVNGVNINEISNEDMKKVRSVVFQDYFRFYSTIRENVAYSELKKMNDDQAIFAALQQGQILQFVDRLNKKIDSNLGNLEDDAIDLSGGQWQKLAISRACLCKSKFIILDEPTASLDPMAESKMYHVFSQVLKDYGYIFISHRLASAKVADRILVLQKGKIIEDGNHNALMEKRGIYYTMFTEQSSWYIENRKTR